MRQAGTGPVFVKIDIEGYEYRIADEIAKLGNYDLRGLQCAVHPQLLEKSLRGPWTLRRLRTLLMTCVLWMKLGWLGDSRSVPRYGGFVRYLLLGILLRRIPKGTDFLIIRVSRQGEGHIRLPGLDAKA